MADGIVRATLTNQVVSDHDAMMASALAARKRSRARENDQISAEMMDMKGSDEGQRKRMRSHSPPRDDRRNVGSEIHMMHTPGNPDGSIMVDKSGMIHMPSGSVMMPVPFAASSGANSIAPGGDGDGDTKEQRRERNKVSASKYRKRRKLYVDGLEARVEAMERQLKEERSKVDNVLAENAALRQELNLYKALVASGARTVMGGAGAGNLPESIAAITTAAMNALRGSTDLASLMPSVPMPPPMPSAPNAGGFSPNHNGTSQHSSATEMKSHQSPSRADSSLLDAHNSSHVDQPMNNSSDPHGGHDAGLANKDKS